MLLRAVVRTALSYDFEITGIEQGFRALRKVL